jgi:uncharacterized membrane protein (DUF485 family)
MKRGDHACAAAAMDGVAVGVTVAVPVIEMLVALSVYAMRANGRYAP